MVTSTTELQRRPFGSFLYWYVACQMAFIVAVYGALTILMLLTYHGLFDYDAFVSLATGMDRYGQIVSVLVLIPLCIAVATAHRLGFWRGVGGYFVGNLLGGLVFLPGIIALTVAERLTDPIQVQLVFTAVSLGYGLVVGFMFWWRWPSRRQATLAHEIAERFD